MSPKTPQSFNRNTGRLKKSKGSWLSVRTVCRHTLFVKKQTLFITFHCNIYRRAFHVQNWQQWSRLREVESVRPLTKLYLMSYKWECPWSACQLISYIECLKTFFKDSTFHKTVRLIFLQWKKIVQRCTLMYFYIMVKVMQCIPVCLGLLLWKGGKTEEVCQCVSGIKVCHLVSKLLFYHLQTYICNIIGNPWLQYLRTLKCCRLVFCDSTSSRTLCEPQLEA